MNILTKNTILISMLLVLQLIPGASSAENQELKLDIHLSKETYFLREPIWLDVTLTNMSSDTIRTLGLFPPCLESGVGIELRDSLGNVMRYTGPVYEFAPRQGFILDTNEQYYDCFDLIELFNTLISMAGGLFGLLPPGNYEVQARYRNAISQKLTFEVKEPTGVEREAFSLLEDGVDLTIMKNQPDSATERFKEIVSRYPTSVYAERVARNILSRHELLQEYPNSGHSAYWLRGITWKKPNEEKQLILQEVIAKTPESRTKRFAEQMLRMLEKQAFKDTTKQEIRR